MKRKLGMLPEVLPEPRAPQPAGDARARTVAHMQRLLATATAAGTAIGGCQKDAPRTIAPVETGSSRIAAVDTSTSSSTSSSTYPSTSSTGSSAEAPDADTTATASTGYIVVDPVPPPATCPGIATQVHATATWRGTAGGWVVDVNLPKGTGPDTVTYGNLGPSAYGGSVVASSAAPDTKLVTVKPDANATSMSVSIPALCNGRPVVFSAGITLGATPLPGAAVPMSFSSY
jgi:hypothetical protein